MSRLGKKEILLPEGVTTEIKNEVLKVNGPKGALEFKIQPGIELKIAEGKILVSRKTEGKTFRALQGTARQLIANMVLGVSQGWAKTLELIGTGYRASLEGEKLSLSLGFSHRVEVSPPAGITFGVAENKVTVSGISRDLVGQTADKIHRLRPPDAYKGKGIRYLQEVIKLKPGKAAKAGAGLTGVK